MLSADVAGLSGSPAPDGPAATAFRAEETGGDRTRTKQTNTQDIIEVNQATEIVEPSLPSPAKVPPSGPGWIHEIKHDAFSHAAIVRACAVDYSRGVYVRPRPRSRVSTSTALRPTAKAFHRLKLLIVFLLLKVLKLAAARITCQLAQYLLHQQNLCIVIDARAKIVIG